MTPRVALREFSVEFTAADVAMARELSTDPYVPQGGSLPFEASQEQALAWVERQRGRLAEGFGYSLVITAEGRAVGQAGLWFGDARGEFSVGYAVVPSARGQGVAAQAATLLVEFARTLDARRVEARVEPWNTASVRTAERAGFVRTGTALHRIGGEEREVLVFTHSGTPTPDR